MDINSFFGALSVGIGIAIYIPYIIKIAKKQAQPHVFTYGIFTFIIGILFFAQLVSGAGAGAWSAGAATLCMACVVILSVFNGNHSITCIDWICAGTSFLIIPFWYLSQSPDIAVLMITVICLIAFIPSFRKGYQRPHEEWALFYVILAARDMINIFAMEDYNFATLFYPVVIVILDLSFALLLTLRRYQIAAPQQVVLP